MGSAAPLTLEDLNLVVITESDASRREVEEAWAMPIGDRVQAGLAIANLEVIERDERQATVRFTENLSKFKVGDNLRLSREEPVQVVRVIEEHRDRLVITPSHPHHKLAKAVQGKGWVLDPALVDLRDNTLRALRQLDEELRAKALGWLSGTLNRATAPAPVPDLLTDNFFPRQRAALELALGSPDPTLVQGPPGTGKTWLMARLVGALLAEGNAVLLTAFTHRAVHNALLAVHKAWPNARIAKLGHPSLAAELPEEIHRLRNRDDLGAELESEQPFVVGATTHAATLTMDNMIDEGALFDHVVIDEASQVSLPFAVAALCRADRATLFGDHKQMGPVILGEYQDPRLERSVFETLWSRRPGVMLDITHRMNTEVCAWPSRAYYGGELKPSQAAAGRRLSGPPQGTGCALDPDLPDVFLVRSPEPDGEPFRSQSEVEIVANLVSELTQHGVPGKEIAVVTPFRVQVRAIREALAKLPGETFEDVVVDTVERIQGQERDVVIVSLTIETISKFTKADLKLSPNRINVAISRARVKRIVVGSASVKRALLAGMNRTPD